RIKDLIFEVSEQIATICGQSFVPYLDTYTRRFQQMRSKRELWNHAGVLTLELHHGHDDLLSVNSLVWNSTALTSSQYRVGDTQRYPADYIELDESAITSYSSNSFSTGITLTGMWGYHEAPDRMWLDSTDDVQDNPLSDSATTLNVSDGTNFEIYQYIRIEDEYLFITDRTANALTVERGVNGTTAAEHTQNTQIDVLSIYPTAQEATRRRVVYLFHNPGEHRRIVALPDGSLELDNEKAIPSPPKRWRLSHV
ncbi:MAG: hypothetical protein ACPG7F_09900, partial [Aggregatilineales bacterium]